MLKLYRLTIKILNTNFSRYNFTDFIWVMRPKKNVYKIIETVTNLFLGLLSTYFTYSVKSLTLDVRVLITYIKKKIRLRINITEIIFRV